MSSEPRSSEAATIDLRLWTALRPANKTRDPQIDKQVNQINHFWTKRDFIKNDEAYVLPQVSRETNFINFEKINYDKAWSLIVFFLENQKTLLSHKEFYSDIQ